MVLSALSMALPPSLFSRDRTYCHSNTTKNMAQAESKPQGTIYDNSPDYFCNAQKREEQKKHRDLLHLNKS